jgi:pSer/pThr/pTyr-binding forkhead associated (FHA) protein
MVRTAFEARTDTLATWGLLQKNCLLLEADKARSKSALTDRLRRVQETREEESPAQAEADLPATQPDRPVIRRIRPLRKPGEQETNINSTEQSPSSPDYLKPVTPQVKRTTKQLKRLAPAQQPASSDNIDQYWLTIVGSKPERHITLPTNGEISLGRFDPNVGIPPDIDLAYEDRKHHLVSRRHATIIGRNGEHTIEDLGSRAGLALNGQPISNGILTPKDRVSLGQIQLIYDKIPDNILARAKSMQVQHILTVTPTGRRYRIAPPRDIVIGHADVQVNFKPDIDLSKDGEVARLVSRRHALIRWRHNQPYVEDLGSGFGTRITGEGLLLGQEVPLKPGDHIWIAGCVLAYDIE